MDEMLKELEGYIESPTKRDIAIARWAYAYGVKDQVLRAVSL